MYNIGYQYSTAQYRNLNDSFSRVCLCCHLYRYTDRSHAYNGKFRYIIF